MMRKILMALAAFVVAPLMSMAGETPITKDNCTVTFIGKKPDAEHPGGFKVVEGTCSHNGTAKSCKLDVTIDVASMYTDDEKLTAHLKSPDFFDLRKYPKAKFKTTSIDEKDGKTTINGDLTLHGTTKKVSFPAKIKFDEDKFSMKGECTIKRLEFGIGTKWGDDQISDEVPLTISVNMNEKK